MQLHTVDLQRGINKAYQKVHVKRAELDNFKKEAVSYLNKLSEASNRDEEHLKGYLSDFLKHTFYNKENRLVQTGGGEDKIDLCIYSSDSSRSYIDVIFETKLPSNISQMITEQKFNTKALQQVIHYYFEEREDGNEDIKHVAVTNYYEFFLFDAQEIERNFYSKKSLVNTFRDWRGNQKVSANKPFMYERFEEFIRNSDATLNAVYVDLRTFETQLKTPASGEDEKLIPLYKFFSPETLVKKPFANDSNTLDEGFYREFLHILGLQEVREKGSRLIQRQPEDERQPGSLIENTIQTLKYGQHMNEVREAKIQYGTNEDDQLLGVALELVITWMNRVLFLKLLEAQLLSYHQQDPHFKFLSFDNIDEYDELNKLFFWVLALKNEDRPAAVQERFGHIPHLNSSLFDATSLENNTIQISGLDDKAVLGLHPRSVLKKGANPPSGKLKTLEYLLRFLDAYSFSAESAGGIQTEDKALINASVLGLIFEKINGYKDGSFFTPGFITEYMARETLRKSVLDKLNETFHWECKEFAELKRKVESADLHDVNAAVNSITICDPAVGSGHFLVSCLNELIAIKSELRILCDREGKQIPWLDIEVENDELAIEYEGRLFEYKVNFEWQNGKVIRKPAGNHRQRIQEALFHEKKFLIENCLFGVDINPNSVKICRLRLWIELLKHAYYKSESHHEGTPEESSQSDTTYQPYSELEVLPNIDINIKQGNSLVSRFELDEDLTAIFKKSEHSLEDYKQAVRNYRQTRDRNEKQRLQQLIHDIKAEYSESLLNNMPINKKLSDARDKYNALVKQGDLFGKKASKIDIEKAKAKVKQLEQQKAEEEAGAFYKEAFEWRFEFPEVLDDEGRYAGFDVVIGNPPWQSLTGKHKSITNEGLINFYKSKYPGNSYMPNLYEYFISRALNITSIAGYICLITPDRLGYNNSLSYLREKLLNKHIQEIIYRWDFPEVIADTVTILIRNFSKEDYEISVKYSPTFDSVRVLKSELAKRDDYRFSAYRSQKIKFIVDKIKISGSVVENISFSTSGFGGKSNLITDKKINESQIPVLKGENIKRFYVSGEKYFKFTDNNITGRTRDTIKLGKKNKVLLRKTGEAIIAAIDKTGRYPEQSAYFLYDIKEDISLEYMVAVLNSKLINWYYLNELVTNIDSTPQLKKSDLDSIPIIVIDPVRQNIFSEKVDKILIAKEQNPEADTTALESQIDRLVYELYGLSEEEIGIVEGDY